MKSPLVRAAEPQEHCDDEEDPPREVFGPGTEWTIPISADSSPPTSKSTFM
jgi:hypothetical protein